MGCESFEDVCAQSTSAEDEDGTGNGEGGHDLWKRR